jgi:hypothetical protein
VNPDITDDYNPSAARHDEKEHTIALPGLRHAKPDERLIRSSLHVAPE